jgi:acyl-CoA synthetase (NDP forming)
MQETARHRLAPMLEPRSIAVVGASQREGSFGLRLAQAVLSAGYKGQIEFVNPRQPRILGMPSHASLADLPIPPDLAILGVGAANIEASLLGAIERGARAAVIFDACYGNAASGAPLLARLRDMAREANFPVCGGAGMGFINVPDACVASFYPAHHLKPGGISLIAHSGSVFTTLAMNDPRFRFDLLVSPGQEIGATIDEYVDFAIQRPQTKVVAIFMETAREPQRFMQSLRKARQVGVPVVVCKVGKSEESARMARTHTGALAGSSAAYEAALNECGAISVDTVDQLLNVALLCSTGRLPGKGGVGLITDSGGLRELAMDCAAEINAPLARLSPRTVAALKQALPPNLEPSNPLDCAGDLTDEFTRVFERGVAVFDGAEEVSMIGLEADLRDDYVYADELLQLARDLPRRTGKPCFFYASFARANNRDLGAALSHSGVPCLNGLAEMLTAVKKLQEWSNGLTDDLGKVPETAWPEIVERWRHKFASGIQMDEHASLSLLSDFGIPAIPSAIAEDSAGLQAAAARLGFPLVLKTAAKGVDHKSDLNGVLLNLADETALTAAYSDLSVRLGPRVIVQAMSGKGIELAFGCIMDPDFGPLVMLSAGGTLIEYFVDRQFALAPFDESEALSMIESLSVAKLLAGVRGSVPKNKPAAAKALSAFSMMCAALSGAIQEIDVNPLIVTDTGAQALDALVVPGK